MDDCSEGRQRSNDQAEDDSGVRVNGGKNRAAAAKPDSGATFRVSQIDRLNRKYGWEPLELTLGDFEPLFLSHREVEKKGDCGAYVPGVIQGDRRVKSAVSRLDWLAIDLDKGEDVDCIIAGVQARGLYTLIHSTHSHLSQEMEVRLDDFRKFMGSNPGSTDGFRRYLLEIKKFRACFLDDLEVTEWCRDTRDGVVCVARHAPIPKYRLVFPLQTPFSRRDDGGNQQSYEASWRAKVAAFAKSLGVEFDVSCTDVSRCFYWPSCKPGAERMARKIDGQLLDLGAVKVEAEDAQPYRSKGPKSCPADTYAFEGSI